jgi:hypothetical protein
MNEELKVTEVEATKIDLKQGDVLMVTVKHEDIDLESLNSLREKFIEIFPNNKVMVFGMGSEGYVKFTIASQPKTTYNDYCTDCDCGKKEKVLEQQENKNDQ